MISTSLRERSSSDSASRRRLSSVAALIRREYQERRTFRFAVTADLILGVLNLVVYFYISHVLRRPSHVQLHGARTYFAFAAVGIAYMVVIQAASAGLTRRLREDELTGTLEALWSQPLSSSAMAFGLAGFQFLFAMLRAAGYLVIAAVWLGIAAPNANWAGALLVLAVSSGALIAIGIGLAAVVVVVGQGQSVANVVVFALGFIGGAYFPVTLLPAPFQALSHLTPTRYALDGMRAALYGHGNWLGSLGLLAAFSVVLIPTALLAFRVALAMSVRRGTLTRG